MRSKAPLALMEQLMMVLTFALAAAVCVQVFALSDKLSQRNAARDKATVLCQSVAETLHHNGGDVEAALTQVSGAEPGMRDGFGYFCSYDESWESLFYQTDRPQQSSYTLRVAQVDSGVAGLGKANVEAFAWRAGTMESLFALDVTWQEVIPHG